MNAAPAPGPGRRKLLSNPFGRSAAFRSALLMTGATYVTYAAGLIVSMIVARSLGPTEFGEYAYLVWLAGTLTILYNSGLTLSGLRFVSESMGRADPAAARNVHGWLRRRHWVSILAVSVAFLCGLPWIWPSLTGPMLWLLAGAALISGIAKSDYLFGSSVAKGYGRFNIEAHTTNLMSVCSLAGTLVLLVMHAPLSWFVLLFIGLSMGHAIMTRLLMHRAGIRAGGERLDPELLARIRQHLWWSIALTMVAALSNKSIETLLLNSLVGPEAVGYFTIAAGLTRGGVDLLSSGLNSILMPVMSHAYGSGGVARVNEILSEAVRYYFFMGLLLAGVGFLWAAPIVASFYGPAYADAILALQVMVVVGGMTMSEGAFGSMMSTTDNQRLRVIISVSNITVSAAMAFLLVPRYGFVGALVAVALSRSTTFLFGVAVLTAVTRLSLPYRDLLRMSAVSLLALSPALGILWFYQGHVPEFIAGAVYGIGCIAWSLLLRVWTQRDVGLASVAAERVPALRGVAVWLQRYARRPVGPETGSP